MNWTPQIIDEMLRLLNEGHSTSQVAAALGTTKNAIIGKSRRERVKRGLITETPRKPRVRTRRDRMLTLPQRADGLSAYISPPAPKPDEGQLASIIDVTGCKWPVYDDPSFIGGYALCNHAISGAGPYCPYHKHASVAPYSAKLIHKTMRAVGVRFPRVA
jgi:hypothetical protein